MCKKLFKGDKSAISVPHQISILFDENPSIEMYLIDYDYVGDAKEVDFHIFANKLYHYVTDFSNLFIAIVSCHMNDTKLHRKGFRFDMTGYCFSKPMEISPISLGNDIIVFLGIIPVVTFEDIKQAVKFLFSGVYDSQNILFLSHRHVDTNDIKNLIHNSLSVHKDRHGYIRNVRMSTTYIYQHKKELRALYPYGGSDFGSFMLFIF